MPQVILFNKPYNVLSQFTDDQGRETLANYLQAPNFRAAGRLDYDSEGLLVLTDSGQLQQHIANPANARWKHYLVQVEGDINDDALSALQRGLELKDGLTLPAQAAAVEPPQIWPRYPPIRVRQTVPDSWLSLSIREGRNRQVRRMTAAVGFPTLRLVRMGVGDWELDSLQPGEHRMIEVPAPPPARPVERKKSGKRQLRQPKNRRR